MKTFILCGLLCAALCILFLAAGPAVGMAAVAVLSVAAWAFAPGARPMAACPALLAFSALPASAATGDSIINALMPHLPEILNSLVIPFIIWAAIQIGRKFGVDIQEKHKRTLHSALTTGANLALERKLTGAAAVGVILDHVLNGKGAPDAVANFKLDKDELARMAEAKLHEVANDALSAAARQAVR